MLLLFPFIKEIIANTQRTQLQQCSAGEIVIDIEDRRLRATYRESTGIQNTSLLGNLKRDGMYKGGIK